MAITVTMPQLGETVTEGTILRWAKQPGDTVSEDEVLLEISTDKVDTEVPSPASGTILEILVAEGETVAVGTPLVVIGDPGEASDGDEEPEPAEEEPAEEPDEEPEPAEEEPEEEPDEEPEPAEEEPEKEPEKEPAEKPAEEPDEEPDSAEEEPEEEPESEPTAAAPAAVLAGSGDGAPLSPVVRRLAAEHEVDLSAVTGTGKGDRITRRDVEAHIESRQKEPAEPETAPEPAPAPAAEPEPAEERAPAPAAPAPAPVSAKEGDEIVELDRLRVRIAENMVRAKHSTAHVWTSVEVDYEAVERVRQRHREAFKEREGFSLTYLPFISRATIDALEAYPVVNSSFDLEGRRRILHRRIDLGVSVDLDQEGLVVMTVRGADGLRLRGIAREVRRVAEKARSGKLEPDDVAGSTFTITNPGPFGSFMSAPIINVPNVAILSTDTVAKRPVVVQDRDGNDAIAIHHVGYLGLTWDHRAFDGSTAVLFLSRIKENLETWDWEQELA